MCLELARSLGSHGLLRKKSYHKDQILQQRQRLQARHGLSSMIITYEENLPKPATQILWVFHRAK